ncbi:MAG: hypothetical protein WBC44_20610 [Planctomycetaceae bacterium]
MFVGSMIAADLFARSGWLLALGLIGFSAAFVTMVGAYVVGFRCPNCNRSITEIFLKSPVKPFGGPVRFCPYCGEDFNACEIDVQLSTVVGSEDPPTESPKE